MIQIQSNPYQRARGAIGRLHGLGDRTLAFVYPHASRRIYSTWLCPPLRVLCFGEGGDVIFNQVVTKWSLIRLPETRLVIEMDPARAYLSLIREVAIVGTKRWIRQHVSNQNELMQSVGGTPTDDPFGKLLFTAVPYQIPQGALKLARTLEGVENGLARSELLAAAIGGLPWNLNAHCFRCGGGGTWRPILKPSNKISKFQVWRFERPENHIPLCNQCENTLDLRNVSLARALGYCYWGCRFEAFLKWVSAAGSNELPYRHWDLETYPLWPKEFGGDRWATGSGSVENSWPRTGRVSRTPQHVEILRRIMQEGEFRPGRMQSGALYQILQKG